MRVISGTAKHLQLTAPKGMDVRPTTDRIKETLFNILAPDIYGCRFLDLFSGTGAIGIEALSRGADSCTFVENSRESMDCIKKNIEKTGLGKNAELIFRDACTAVSSLDSSGKKFDLIFMDPPYDCELEKQVLFRIAETEILDKDGMIIVEASEKTDFGYLEDTCFCVTREKKYGSNKHIFIAYRWKII